LYHHYADAIYGIIHRILRRQEESEEVLQSVFLKIWNNIDSYNESKATLFTWMAQIARNAAIDMKRLKSFEMASNTSSFDNTEYGMASESSEKNVDIQALIKNMPEKYKILLDKMFLEGYTQQEISDELEIPLGTVKTRLRDAIQTLRETLKDEKHLLYLLSLLS
jgi:RNA polymerase sigma-70 factor, ECF subfamily